MASDSGKGNGNPTPEAKTAAPTPMSGKRLLWTDIIASVPAKWGQKGGRDLRRIVLDKVSGIANPGETLAIMGGSGAGKTTLMNIFVNIHQENIYRRGEVYVNNEILSDKQMRRISAYVQQVDMFIGTLKVKEQLKFSAALRMSRKFTGAQRQARVDEVIRELGLTNAANTMIGIPGRVKGISVGEKKRLAFACEILTDPMILFCDEPTSGLDSFMAQQVVSALSELAKKGKTIISTIHQPSTQVFHMFDKVCFMARGKVAYFGPTRFVPDFWKSVGPELECPVTFNPADHAIMTLSNTSELEDENDVRIAKIRKAFEDSFYGRELFRKTHSRDIWSRRKTNNDDVKKSPQYSSNWFTQFRVLFMRALLTTLRDPLLLKVRLFQVFVTAIIIGIVNWRTPITGPTIMNLEGMLYNCARDMNFMFLFPSINVITSELPIFTREHKSGIYAVETYYLSKSLAELPQYTVLPIIYSIIVYFSTGLYLDFGRPFVFALINVVQTWVAISIAYAGACIFGVDDLALTYMPVFILPMLVFGGFYINVHTIPIHLYWASYVSWFRYGFEALQINQWTAISAIPNCNESMFTGVARSITSDDYCPATNGSGLLERRGMPVTTSYIWYDLLSLGAMFLMFRAIGLVALNVRIIFCK